MADDNSSRIRARLLERVLRVLSTPSSELAAIACDVKGVVASDHGDDPLMCPSVVGDDNPPWLFRDVPPAITGDVWIGSDPPNARANRRALPQLRIAMGSPVDDLREALWFLRSLRNRARTYERIVGELACARPTLATARAAIDVDPVPVRQLVEATGMHESTIERVARACRIENRHRVFALHANERDVRLAD